MSINDKKTSEPNDEKLRPATIKSSSPVSATMPESKSAGSFSGRVKERLILPLLLLITGLAGYNAYKTTSAPFIIDSPPPAVRSFVDPRYLGERRNAPEEVSESAVELFYKELGTHGTVETEINNLLDAKVFVVSNLINQRCKDETKSLLDKYLSDVQANSTKIKSEHSPELLDQTINKIDSLYKRAISNCP